MEYLVLALLWTALALYATAATVTAWGYWCIMGGVAFILFAVIYRFEERTSR